MHDKRQDQPQFDEIQSIPEYLTKMQLAKAYSLSVRTIDNFLARGLPHLAIGKRRVRIEASEAHEWMRREFSTRRLRSHPASPATE